MCLHNYVIMHSLRWASITTIVKHSNAQKPSCMLASSGSYSSSAAPEPCTSSACCSGCAKPAKPAEMACCCSCKQMQSLCQHWEVICEAVIAMQVKQLGGRMGAAHAITDCTGSCSHDWLHYWQVGQDSLELHGAVAMLPA